jgi:hypothetical protein
MKKVFTKYLVFVFLIPILILFIFYFFGTRTETSTYSVNRKINFGGIDLDEILRNPIYNLLIFYFSYPIYLFIYLIIFLTRRYTNFLLSILHFIIVIINYILLCNDAKNRLIIPLFLIGFITFIFNIFKTTKSKKINQQRSTTK